MRERNRDRLAIIGIGALMRLSASGQMLETDPDALDQQLKELYQAGKYSEAIPIAKRVVELREQKSGPEHLETATSLNNLAFFYQMMGEHAEAEPRYQRALKIRQKILGPDHLDTAQSLNNLAGLYDNIGDP